MKEQVILHVEHISKRYILGQIGGTTLRNELQRFSARIHRREDPTKKIGARNYQKGDAFCALDDISFDVKTGERVGIIGRNGAGKSTLLKLISRITAPTSGIIGLNGRVASMLEVGTGFHPELTGRENIYMNGAILGMSKREIDRKIEDIIEFSECRQFIDTPVKRYSSGMYVKLAFSVAAHLDSEIMIMDEVLAVGDIAFQKKCIDKMNEVSLSEGRTILYVSHNMNTIRELCTRCIVLDQGKKIFEGDVQEGIRYYARSAYQEDAVNVHLADVKRPWQIGIRLRMLSVEQCGKQTAYYQYGEEMKLRIAAHAAEKLENVSFRVEFQSDDGVFIGTCVLENVADIQQDETKDFLVSVPLRGIVPGKYRATLTAYLKSMNRRTMDLDYVVGALGLEIGDPEGRLPLQWFTRNWGRIVLNESDLNS